MSYVPAGIGAWYDPLRAIYDRARKLQPGKIFAREVGIPPGSQVQVAPPSTGFQFPQGDWVKPALYVGGGLLLFKLLQRRR